MEQLLCIVMLFTWLCVFMNMVELSIIERLIISGCVATFVLLMIAGFIALVCGALGII
jgi:hypothetical protein